MKIYHDNDVILHIDNRETRVRKGTRVIEAAEEMGITIPRFCYHPALGSVGACRACAVKFTEGPLSGIHMSCMVEAEDGMRVETADREVVSFRKHIIEWLMRNHPHDCPVCDEGGRCLLQEMTLSGGHFSRRYRGGKRTHQDQDLGPLIQHEMNRCIQCCRCVRFYREFSGYGDLGTFGIGEKIYFGRRTSGTLESPFSGNLIDICPTGVFTDKPSRFKGRRWEMERRESVCINCSLGCNTWTFHRYREVAGVEPRFNGEINEHFMCDRGRYGFFHTDQKERPRSARVNGRKTPHARALREAREGIERITEAYGPSAVAFVGSARNAVETMENLNWICSQTGRRPPVFWTDPHRDRVAGTGLQRLTPHISLTLKKLAHADMILAVGIDPVNEAPMAALSMHRALKNGARVAVLDPRPVSLPHPFTHIPAAPRELAETLGQLLKACSTPHNLNEANFPYPYKSALADVPPPPEGPLTALATALNASERTAVVCGTGITDPETVNAAADLAEVLRYRRPDAGLFLPLQGPNAYGAALLSDEKADVEDLIADMEKGVVKALVAVESDPLSAPSEPGTMAAATANLELFVALDHIPTATVLGADIFLPTTPHYESGGIFINNEGRAQESDGSPKAGMPIAQTGNGGHPPREFGGEAQGAEAAFLTLEDLTGISCGYKKFEPKAYTRPPTIPLISRSGLRVHSLPGPRQVFTMDWKPVLARPRPPSHLLTLLLVEETFGTEELSSASPCLKELEKPPKLLMHPMDAGELDLVSGDTVSLSLGNATLSPELEVKENMARGILVLPRRRSFGNVLPEGTSIPIEKDRLRRVSRGHEGEISGRNGLFSGGPTGNAHGKSSGNATGKGPGKTHDDSPRNTHDNSPDGDAGTGRGKETDQS